MEIILKSNKKSKEEIKGFAETLHDGTVEKPEDIERFFGIVIKHINRLDAIAEDLLTLSKSIPYSLTKPWLTSLIMP